MESPHTFFRAPDLEERIFSCHNLSGEYSDAEEKVNGRTFYAGYDLYKLFRAPIFPDGYLGYPKQRLSPRKWLYSVFNVVLAISGTGPVPPFRRYPNLTTSKSRCSSPAFDGMDPATDL
ncbi:MAG: hypothetical protein METHAR1v1_310013 [Methanothrix sp.]|jgi:hypothetical protein|nr:MAG: hypothetical protein METHAR1v1_310013 [Methanothrix sp.]